MQHAIGAAAPHVDLLLLGGGHSHIAVVRRFGMQPMPGVRVTLLSRDTDTPYSGMLPGLVAGHFDFADCHIDLERLCASNGVRLIQGTARGIDTAARQVLVDDRPALRYDWLSLNTGSHPALDSIPGASDHGIAVKPVDRFLAAWTRLEQDLAANPRDARVVVVGGGAAGVEITLACQHRLRATLGEAASRIRFTLLCATPELLATHNPRVRRHFRELLRARGITVHCGQQVARAEASGVTCSNGGFHSADAIVWAIHAGAPDWLAASGLACDAGGFVRVDSFLRSQSDARIFAVGDIAAFTPSLAKSGVYAVREGAVLAENLQRAIRDRPLRPYRPQKRFLSLLTTGDRQAVASRGPLFAAGAWVWRWKRRIDRAFMDRYRVMGMPASDADSDGMRCGGCAAKVSADVLACVIPALPPRDGADVVAGIAAADDAAVIAPPPGQQLVQSVDYFRAFIDDPWLFGRIAVMHAVSDIVAMGARPHSALAIATVPYGPRPLMEDNLRQLMLGARAALDQLGVTLVGGHSNEGAELAFGLSVNGFAAPADLLFKSGLRDDRALILTKPLGHGVLMAARMRAAAQAAWVDAALRNMLVDPLPALAVLRRHGVMAATDITGFGLLGHLVEMVDASRIGVRLRRDALPALPGALDCLRRGYRSSLEGGNRSHLRALVDANVATDQALLDLLLDPQTAGGLLAGVPLHNAEDCLAQLRAAGYADAAIIGYTDAGIPAGRIRLD